MQHGIIGSCIRTNETTKTNEIEREPMANGITFVQDETNSDCKGASKAANGIPME